MGPFWTQFCLILHLIFYHIQIIAKECSNNNSWIWKTKHWTESRIISGKDSPTPFRLIILNLRVLLFTVATVSEVPLPGTSHTHTRTHTNAHRTVEIWMSSREYAVQRQFSKKDEVMTHINMYERLDWSHALCERTGGCDNCFRGKVRNHKCMWSKDSELQIEAIFPQEDKIELACWWC